MNHRNHRSGWSLIWMVLAAVLLVAPVAASADHDERRRGAEASRRDDRHRGGERVDARHRDDRRYDAFRGDHRVSRSARNHRQAHRRVDSQRHRHGAPFYCRPCRGRFHSKLGFRRHLHRHHHVAPWRASRRIVHDAFGWIFFG